MTLNRSKPFTGVAQRLARRAHNPEVVCSIHTAGIVHFARFTETRGHSSRDPKHEHNLHRGGAAAARQAHNLQDTGSRPVPGIITLRQLYRSCHPFTGMAQRQRAGLITPRSLDQNQFPVSYTLRVLQKRVVIAHATLNMSTTTPRRCSSAEERLKPRLRSLRPAMVR